MSFSFVSMVESNVKGGVSCRLGPKTLLVGPVGSGKSSVVQSIELALTGRVSDLAGLDAVAKEVDLMALAWGRCGTLQATVTLSTGERAGYETSGNSSRAKKSKHTLPAGVNKDSCLPLRVFRNAVIGRDVSTSRRFFLERAVGDVTWEDVFQRLPAALHERFKRLVRINHDGGTRKVVTGLLEGMLEAEKLSDAASSRIKEATIAINVQAGSVAPVEADIFSAKTLVEGLEAELAEVLLHADRKQLKAQNIELLEAFYIQREAACAERDKIVAALATLPHTSSGGAAANAVAVVLEWLDKHGGVELSPGCLQCPVCNGMVTKADVCAWLAYIRSATAEGLRSEATRRTLQEKHARILSLISFLETRLRDVRCAIDAGAVGASDVRREETVIREELSAARDRRDSIMAAAKLWSNVQRERDSKALAEEERVIWGRIRDACKVVVADLLETSMSAFEAKVQSFLCPSDRFRLRLHDGAREVLQFGLLGKPDDTLRTALSGGEWARMTAALAGATLTAGLLNVVIPEERAFDPQSLYQTLVAFSSIPAQVVVTSTILPSSTLGIPAEWTVIDMQDGQKASSSWREASV